MFKSKNKKRFTNAKKTKTKNARPKKVKNEPTGLGRLGLVIANGTHNTINGPSSSTFTTDTGVSNVGLLPAAARLQDDMRKCKTELFEVTQLIKQYNARKRELESQMNLIKSELKLLSERDSSLVEFSRNDFPWSQNMWDKLESVFSIKEFRSQQLAVINATMSKIDCLLIMPTGGGKSLCFQLPAVLTPGITIVISPLISLMEDQYQSLKALNIPTAIFSSQSSREEAKGILAALAQPLSTDLKLVYATPEKLAKSKRLMANLEKLYKAGRFARLVVDEVHCCSTWGHDFRPDYKFLSIMKTQFPNTPILGLTATATTQVIVDVQKILNIESCLVFKDTFFRPKLIYEVFDCNPTKKIEFLANMLKSRFTSSSSGIIYCLTIKDTEDVAKQLKQEHGIRAAAYHAQLEPDARTQIQAKWYTNEYQIIVATIAFGMGINKLDVEFVIHYSMSKSLENYYQETGRAGRDGREAYCILLFNLADVFRTTQIMMTEKNGKRNVYNMLKYSLDHKTCRKKFMAQYFGDVWDDTKDLCNQHCDNCVKSKKTSKEYEIPRQIKVKSFYEDVLKVIEHADSLEERLTLIKLNDALYKKGSTKLRLDSLKVPEFGKEICENMIGLLLLDEYLEEEFHFTPYSTISYIVPGKRGIPSNDMQLEIPPSRSKAISWKSIVRKEQKSEPLEAGGKKQEQKTEPQAFVRKSEQKTKQQEISNKPESQAISRKPEQKPEATLNWFDKPGKASASDDNDTDDDECVIESFESDDPEDEEFEFIVPARSSAGKVTPNTSSSTKSSNGDTSFTELNSPVPSSSKKLNQNAVAGSIKKVEVVDLTSFEEPPAKKFKFKKLGLN